MSSEFSEETFTSLIPESSAIYRYVSGRSHIYMGGSQLEMFNTEDRGEEKIPKRSRHPRTKIKDIGSSSIPLNSIIQGDSNGAI